MMKQEKIEEREEARELIEFQKALDAAIESL